MKLAKQRPDEFTQAGKWFGNAIVFLTHLENDTIRTWMEPRWHAYCVAGLELAIPEVKNTAIRGDLLKWLASIKEAPSLLVGRKLIKDKPRWDLLKEHTPARFKGPQALPFLGNNYRTIGAFAIALDQLLPSLKTILLADVATPAYPAPLPIITAYKAHVGFRTALNASVLAKNWDSVEAFLLTQRELSVAGSQRC